MDPLAVGIFTVAAESPLQSALFVLGGMLTFIGIGYAAIIGMAGDKHKSIGMALMFMGSGIAAYPTLSMTSVVLGGSGNMFALGGIDIRPIVSALMIFSSVVMLLSALKEKELSQEEHMGDFKEERSITENDDLTLYKNPIGTNNTSAPAETPN